MSGGRYDGELRALREAIKTARAVTVDEGRPASAPSPEPQRDDSELIASLRQVKDGLVHAAEGADDIIISHPVASVGGAFLLGLAVGRLLRGI